MNSYSNNQRYREAVSTHTLLHRPVRWCRRYVWLSWGSLFPGLMPAAQARQSATQPPRPTVIPISPVEKVTRHLIGVG